MKKKEILTEKSVFFFDIFISCHTITISMESTSVLLEIKRDRPFQPKYLYEISRLKMIRKTGSATYHHSNRVLGVWVGKQTHKK
jgi:hypothetical protein